MRVRITIDRAKLLKENFSDTKSRKLKDKPDERERSKKLLVEYILKMNSQK